MASEQHQQQFETRDVDKLVERAKTFKEDLDVGKGWTQRLRVPNEYNSWSKTFPEEEVPVKVLSKFENLPIPAAKVAEMLSPSTMETRKKWDKAFADLEILETLPDGSVISYYLGKLSFPLTDREFVIKFVPPVEIDWFDKRAHAVFMENAVHASKPPGVEGVRATNGGNFYIAVPDDEEPGVKCEVFALSNNNYNGWLPDKFEWLIAPKISQLFYEVRDSLNEGYKKYFS